MTVCVWQLLVCGWQHSLCVCVSPNTQLTQFMRASACHVLPATAATTPQCASLQGAVCVETSFLREVMGG